MKNLEKTQEELTKKLIEHEKNNNYDNDYKNLLIKSYEQNIITINYFLNAIDKIINYNIELAKELYNYITTNYNLDTNKIEINYLKNKINELVLYNNLSQEHQNLYNFYLTKGSKAYKRNDLNTALNYYKEGKNLTNHPIFDYYIGKIYFKLRNFDLANKYISRYELNGGEKEIHALLYLWGNDKYLQKSQILELDNKAKKLINCFDNLKNWNLPDFRTKLVTRKKEKNSNITKYKNNKNISISENDFIEKNLTLDQFDNYSFKDKLIFIRQTFNNGDITLATKLLKQLETSKIDSQSRKQVSTLKKLMKIKK